MMVEVLFQQCPGFRKVRMIGARPGIALVEFHQSMVAMQALQGFRMSLKNPITISYAKK
jgi:U2 small nuclear ribonucleoprotein B''